MKYIPFNKPHLPKITIRNIAKVINSGWITTGPVVKKFEDDFCKLINARRGVAVSSCTAALHLSYIVSNLKKGDEVIVPSFTFCSTINTIVHTGATPVFCDIKEDTLCIDPEDIKKKITSRTKAIVVVHFSGMPADLDKINKIAKLKNIAVIEDAAHAFLAKFKGFSIGNGSNIVCFSFYATKNLTTVEGGMIICRNKKNEDLARILSLHGISKYAWNRYTKSGSWRYEVAIPGYKYNLTDINAAIGLSQLKNSLKAHKRRLALVNHYRKLLTKSDTLILPIKPPYKNSEHAWHLFIIQVKDSSNFSRDELIEKLKEKGIGTSVHFLPNHTQPYYKKRYNHVRLPVTERVADRVISLPLYEDLKFKEVEYICNTINKLTLNL